MLERWVWVAEHYSRFLELAENSEVLDIRTERCVALCEIGRYREGLEDAVMVLKENKPDDLIDRYTSFLHGNPRIFPLLLFSRTMMLLGVCCMGSGD